MSQIWNRLVMLFSGIGVFIAGVLSYSEVAQKEIPCGVGSTCTQVTTSQWSHFLGMPVAYLGLATYVVILVLALLRSAAVGKNWSVLTIAGLALSGFGFGFSVYLQIVSITEVHDVCKWCFASAVTMFLTFLMHGFVYNAGGPAEVGEVDDSTPPAPKMDFAVAGAVAVLAIGGLGFMTMSMDKERTNAIPLDFTSVSGEDIVPEAAKVKGPADAPVTLVEFADMNCPACRATFPTVEKVYKEYNGKIRLAFRHVPLYNLQGHETSASLAVVSQMAAEKNKFWDFLETVMQPGNTERIKTEAGIVEIGSEVGLDPVEVRKVLKEANSKYLDQVSDDLTLAQADLKITGTPTFVILAKGVKPKAVQGSALEQTLKGEPYGAMLK